jgi:hypothetical protein
MKKINKRSMLTFFVGYKLDCGFRYRYSNAYGYAEV